MRRPRNNSVQDAIRGAEARIVARPNNRLFNNDEAAQEAYEAIAEIGRGSGRDCDAVTNDEIIEAARNPENALHQYFEWDPGRAHYRYLIQRVGELRHSFKATFTKANGDVICLPGTLLGRIVQDEGQQESIPTLVAIQSDDPSILTRNATRAFQSVYGSRGSLAADPEGRFTDIVRTLTETRDKFFPDMDD